MLLVLAVNADKDCDVVLNDEVGVDETCPLVAALSGSSDNGRGDAEGLFVAEVAVNVGGNANDKGDTVVPVEADGKALGAEDIWVSGLADVAFLLVIITGVTIAGTVTAIKTRETSAIPFQPNLLMLMV